MPFLVLKMMCKRNLSSEKIRQMKPLKFYTKQASNIETMRHTVHQKSPRLRAFS